MKLDWNDISIVPAELSPISSRSEINPFTIDGQLPLFTAPMDTVIDESNIHSFEKNFINICLPRHVKYSELKNDNYFYSYGLDEIVQLFESDAQLPKKVLIDVANGHMQRLYDVSKQIKEKYGDQIELMVGNIANPHTYRKYCEIGVDYIRVGIGGGCFSGDMKVMTLGGLKCIKDINDDDYVLTHKNQYKRVLQKHEFKNYSKILNVNNIKVTDNHEFYVINKEDRSIVNDMNIEEFAYWIQAAFLDKEKHLLVDYS